MNDQCLVFKRISPCNFLQISQTRRRATYSVCKLCRAGQCLSGSISQRFGVSKNQEFQRGRILIEHNLNSFSWRKYINKAINKSVCWLGSHSSPSTLSLTQRNHCFLNVLEWLAFCCLVFCFFVCLCFLLLRVIGRSQSHLGIDGFYFDCLGINI